MQLQLVMEFFLRLSPRASTCYETMSWWARWYHRDTGLEEFPRSSSLASRIGSQIQVLFVYIFVMMLIRIHIQRTSIFHVRILRFKIWFPVPQGRRIPVECMAISRCYMSIFLLAIFTVEHDTFSYTKHNNFICFHANQVVRFLTFLYSKLSPVSTHEVR